MSVTTNSTVSVLEVIESQIRCPDTKLLWKDKELSRNNDTFMRDLYVLMSCIWYDITFHPDLLNQRWVNSLLSEPVDKVVSFFKDVDYAIITQSISSKASFKHWLKTNYPTFGQIISPIVENIYLFFKQGKGLPSIRTALRFITKANFPNPLGLEEEALDEWKTVCFEDYRFNDVTAERDIITDIFPRNKTVCQIEPFHPRFGPGKTFNREVRSLLDKYLDFTYDDLLLYVGHKVDFSPMTMPISKRGDVRTHRVKFVPKQLDKLRVISMEPSSLMFYQLGVASFMETRFSRSRWRKHINLRDAELNRDLAWEGSLTGEYATIDLSHASDSVKYGLVKDLFRDSCLRESITGLRSKYAECNGVIYTPEYFAPMGSGLCFPVECAVFAAIVDNVMSKHRDTRAWRVYGDDIICPSDRAYDVIERLTELQFTVNIEKSFVSTTPGFRESCGGDYYLGEDVRPVLISRKWSGLIPKISRPSTIDTNIQLANSLIGYKYARLRVLKGLKDIKPPVMYDDTGYISIFSQSPTNFHTLSRRNEAIQCTQFYVGRISSSTSNTGSEFESIRLFESLRATMGRVSDQTENFPVSIGRPSKQKWVGSWSSPAPGWE